MANFRINVLGASGSGATTVGKSLASLFCIPHFDCDDYFHLPSDPPFQKPRPAKERCRLLEADLGTRQNWVLSGGVVGWDPSPNLGFTCHVFLHLPTSIRLQRLKSREKERFGSRIEQGGDMHQTHTEFLEWASKYDQGGIEGKTLQRHVAYLQQQPTPVFEYRGEMSVKCIVGKLESEFQDLGWLD